MDSGHQAAVYGGGGRSGGKILKRLPIAARNTPYDRLTAPLQPENPNWLNAFVFPAKFFSGGAGKLLSSVWNPKSWGSCSSSSSSSESDSDSEGGVEDDYEPDGNLHDDGAVINQNKGSSSGKSEILDLVEQLLMRERFSREECDRLIKILNLRVVDYSTREGMDAGPNNSNISNKMIMQARKMIKENPVGSSVISDLDNSIHGSKSLVTPNMDYHGSWNIQNEIQRLHSKAIQLLKPNIPFSLQSLKPCSSLPAIKEKKQMAEGKGFKDHKAGDDVNRVEGNSDMITEYAEVGYVIHASQGSSNTNYPTSTNETDSPSSKRAATRTRIYNTRSRSGRPLGK
ncbi:hypothetical protein HanRHA438_Chr03g0136381 [Helianthus annuus]|uniref:Uncharacterized protein n=1 Tax=Helianthus annuus TaxID=4232 RepID=A0A251VBP0_HELAN|nr:protein KAKU4 [Helianthus annuus]KAF5815565.1 hypothetical protein HanXRQr2_Chr03g0124491 [Helianthus annuus]KAJ0594006.1 hypothetical protein HanHA300_Chr03g0103751 [Helianthus annuus]KAJ0609027.1 hypothetical protein HanHA89_Chr03g0115391 [Helianthus annuus]KAJ0769091.1 hypothetical protein HanLR1_Chr03g0108971 [Helianthus annuus]KAJ0936919.1 hypothetical protein HanRHA438_Chr03g0136381 [Helianthus annuus]